LKEKREKVKHSLPTTLLFTLILGRPSHSLINTFVPAQNTQMSTGSNLNFDNTWKNKLDFRFYSEVKPTPVTAPYLISFNKDVWQNLLGQSEEIQQQQDLPELLSGNKLFRGSEPTAALYAGHQFGYLTPQLGDGRAILLGQLRNNQTGKLYDMQLKGGGRTPYSRMGDGRAVLRSTIREYLGAEAMHHLRIPTTRSLSIVGTDDTIYRERRETGAMLIRVCPSHVRIGNFEVFHYRGKFDLVRKLADFVIEENFTELQQLGEGERYLALFRTIVESTAKLMAQWQAVGFAHGVMNTDNFSILGLTIDYGPFAFLDNYDPEFICNHSDYEGRYAFDQQPEIGRWNMERLADAFTSLPNLSDVKQVRKIYLDLYDTIYEKEYYELMSAKLGLDSINKQLVDELLGIMAHNFIDYTNMFRALGNLMVENGTNTTTENQFISRFFSSSASCQVERMQKWLKVYKETLAKQTDFNDAKQVDKLRAKMHGVNPKYIMRNYLLQVAIEKAHKKDFSEVERLLEILRRPYDEQPENESYADDAPQWASKIQISCSS
jgi:uncharacterized protein YdiU (UPF0061 family)